MQSAGMVFGRTNATIGIFLTFYSIEDVNAFQASKALRNCTMRVLKQKHQPFGISINPLYFSDSYFSIFFKNTEDSNEMAHNAAFY